MKEIAGIQSLYGKFIKGNIVDMDFSEPKGFRTELRKSYTPEQWKKRRQELLKVKLP